MHEMKKQYHQSIVAQNRSNQSNSTESKMMLSHSGGDRLPSIKKRDINLIGINNNLLALAPQTRPVILKMDKSIIFESVGTSAGFHESQRNNHSVYNSLAQSTDSQMISPI
jgi:hypothetical protein